MVACKMKLTETGESLKEHLPKETTNAKENGPRAEREMGLERRFHTSDWMPRPGAKESPGGCWEELDDIVQQRGGGRMRRRTHQPRGRGSLRKSEKAWGRIMEEVQDSSQRTKARPWRPELANPDREGRVTSPDLSTRERGLAPRRRIARQPPDQTPDGGLPASQPGSSRTRRPRGG